MTKLTKVKKEANLSGSCSITDDEGSDESRVDVTVVDGGNGEDDVGADLSVDGLLKLTSALAERNARSGA